EDGIRDDLVTGVQTCALPISKTGLCAQSNNTIIVESDAVAKAYFDYWTRLHADKLPVPKPLSAQLGCEQGPALRKADATPSSTRSEERRVGKGRRAQGAPDHE